jgi:hypothetical protein
MRLRAHGTPEECRRVVDKLTEAFRVVSVSHPYPDRGPSTLVRVYLDVCLDDPPSGRKR